MISKRIGQWSWTLSADERKTAALVARRQAERTTLSAKLQRKHDAMLEKQHKLDKLERQNGRAAETLAPGYRQRFTRRSTPGIALSESGTQG